MIERFLVGPGGGGGGGGGTWVFFGLVCAPGTPNWHPVKGDRSGRGPSFF